MRRAGRLQLTDDERAALRRWSEAGSAAMASRARIILESEQGGSAAAVARELRVSASTVLKWRARFAPERLAGLLDAPRTGAGHRVDEALVRRAIEIALHEPPPEGRRWTTRALARAAGLSQSTVSRICRSVGLLSDRPAPLLPPAVPIFEGTECDLAGVLVSPPDRMFAFCRRPAARPPRPPIEAPTPPAELRCRVLELLHAASAAPAERSPRERAVQVWRFLDAVERRATPEADVHLLVERATLRLPGISRWLSDHPRFRPAFLPAGDTWRDVLERWCCRLLAAPADDRIRRRPRELKAALEAHVAQRAGAPFAWMPQDAGPRH